MLELSRQVQHLKFVKQDARGGDTAKQPIHLTAMLLKTPDGRQDEVEDQTSDQVANGDTHDDQRHTLHGIRGKRLRQPGRQEYTAGEAQDIGREPAYVY